jgi:CBS domain-containing protein
MGNKKDQVFGFESLMRACSANRLGLLDQSFLCQSVGILDPRSPICVGEGESIGGVIQTLKERRIGCVLVVGDSGLLTGIFSERDVVLKVFGNEIDLQATPVRDLMTPDPVAERADTPIAYALNLMSAGGFRHLPIVDVEGKPVGIISVKDIVDFMVNRLAEDLLNVETVS